MTATELAALWATVGACIVIAAIDPAQRARRWWWRARNTPRPGDEAHLPQHRGEGAAPAVVAPSPVADTVYFEAPLPPRQVRNLNAQLEWRYSHTKGRAEA